MNPEIEGIVQREDAERLSRIILESLPDDRNIFNPFRGRILKRNDGSIVFKGNSLEPHNAAEYLADYIWKNRNKVNRQFKKWKIAGSKVVDCGC